MSTIVTRSGKGSPLTHVEVDANFTNLNTDKYQEGSAIGAVTPAAGTFTTLTATGQANLGGSSTAPSFRATVGDNSPNTMWVETKGASSSDSAVYLGVGGTPSKPLIIANSANSISFRTTAIGGTANQQLNVAHTVSAVNYVQVTGAATGSNPTISTQGSDTNTGLTLQSKGTFGFTFRNSSNGTVASITHGGSSTPNYVQLSATVSGSAPSLNAAGSDTNIDLTLTPKGTGVVQFGSYTASVLTPTGYITVKDSGGTTRRLLVG